jgi:hypothetical protein
VEIAHGADGQRKYVTGEIAHMLSVSREDSFPKEYVERQ